jgi:hypothetical protein
VERFGVVLHTLMMMMMMMMMTESTVTLTTVTMLFLLLLDLYLKILFVICAVDNSDKTLNLFRIEDGVMRM